MNPNCTHTDLLIQNYTNFTKSAVPVRFMFYENGSWSDFSADVADHLRNMFSDRKVVVAAEIKGVHCLIDFSRMLQIKLDGGDQRSIAWIDINGNCFFPKRFIDSNGKLNGNGEVNGQFNGGDKLEEVRECEVVSARWPKAQVLREGETAYEGVKSLFLAGLRGVDAGARVTGIHQVVRVGFLDKARAMFFNKQMEIIGNVRGGVNVRYAWHGTSEKGVEVILRHGFSKVRKVEGGEGFGVGVYLSPVRSAQMSAMLSKVDGNGEKHVILCRVILGNCEKVEAGSQQMYPSSVNFDSGVDDLVNPNWFVVWGSNMNTHIIPECVVSYWPSTPLAGNGEHHQF